MTDTKHPLIEQIDFKSITGITADSRQVQKGTIFVAIAGTQQNGADYIPNAINNGSALIICNHETLNALPADVQEKCIAYENTRQALSILSAHYYKPQPDCMVAITGTNGKTSVAEFTRQLWALTGLKSASVGTLGVTTSPPVADIAGYDCDVLTTPDAVRLHQDLSVLAKNGVDHVSLEASSIGIDMHRMDGLKLNAAAFTNLSRDHLDYHGTMHSYRACKYRLFGELLPKSGTAVINANCTDYDGLFNACSDRGIRVISYGIGQGEIRTLKHTAHSYGFDLTLDILGNHFDVTVPLLGEFQISNILASVGLLVACGSDPTTVARHVGNLSGIKGRLQRAGSCPNGAVAYVDFAHTPDGLETVLKSVRPHVDTAGNNGKIHVVFGCGGDRDTGKRPLMAQVAEHYADTVIVTDDNPRTEDPAQIREQVMAGCTNATNIGGREQAIAHALNTAGEHDIIIIAGKGHEQGQIVGTEVLPFDDISVTQNLIAQMGN